jgi:hypothetical protein
LDAKRFLPSYDIYQSVAVLAFTLVCIIDRFDKTVSQADADNVHRKPKATHKHQMGHIPYPFETKGKHIYETFAKGPFLPNFCVRLKF